jgi:prophage DNA circulation protein
MPSNDPVAAPGGNIQPRAPGSNNTAGGMPQNVWRARFMRASFRGVPFFTDMDGVTSGRRIALHEYPKQDIGWAEDMGRRAKRHTCVGYVVGGPILGFNYIQLRENLIGACDAEGPGTLVHPFLGSMVVSCETYTCLEDQKRGGVAMFEMNFVEAGLAGAGQQMPEQTQPAVAKNAANAEQAEAGSFSKSVTLGTGFGGGQTASNPLGSGFGGGQTG